MDIIEFSPQKYLFTLNRFPLKTHGQDGLPLLICSAPLKLTAPPAFLIFWLLMVVVSLCSRGGKSSVSLEWDGGGEGGGDER